MIMIRLCLIVWICGIFYTTVHSSSKRGVTHWMPKFMCNDLVALNNVTWWYDWGKNLTKYDTDTLNCSDALMQQYAAKYVPMIWSYYPKTVVHLQPNTTHVLAFNEPNHKSQANRTPAKATQFWPNVVNDSEGRIIVSPSAAPCGANCLSNTTEWFDEFFQLCSNCQMEYLATHSYHCNVDQVMAFLQMLYNRYNKKIWLTEFACGDDNPDPNKQLNFMKAILPRLEAADYIYRYAWFTARVLTDDKMIKTPASLLKPDSSELTELGQYYNNYVYVPPPPTA